MCIRDRTHTHSTHVLFKSTGPVTVPICIAKLKVKGMEMREKLTVAVSYTHLDVYKRQVQTNRLE